ncbi:OmpH family outer membrane protein [Leeuwenhoekiella sp. ZYFB001]|uniref:OmpH family outer membrane protein n=1 Tax=Leeuwenhoekiella sp. ZYFB001 TaxID=2719912 RepID=UPI0014315D71|nr:OmpH family outer membrane protein [Leeuwenhoekiella sp. ZYFB001]
MKTKLSLFVVAVAFTLASCTKSKSAFVDTQKLFEEYSEMTEVQDKYTKLTDEVREELQPKIQAFQIKVDLYQKNASTMSPAERQAKEQELGALQQEIQQMQQARGGQIQQESQAAIDSVISKVRKFIDTYGEENGYDFIYGKNESGNVLYGNKKLDITDDILKALNTSYSSGETTSTSETQEEKSDTVSAE